MVPELGEFLWSGVGCVAQTHLAGPELSCRVYEVLGEFPQSQYCHVNNVNTANPMSRVFVFVFSFVLVAGFCTFYNIYFLKVNLMLKVFVFDSCNK